MSGGGQLSGEGGSGGGGAPTDVPCDQLTFQARLQSPQLNVVSLLELGDELAIDLTDDPAVQATNDQGLAGHVTTRLPDLIRCINSGFEFIAIVDEVDGGNVVLTIKPKP